MPNWTLEQKQAIDEEGKNIIVSAGAGSGKTAVLTARVIRKLKDGVDVNRLLVLTFTNEAANEMKERIYDAIKKEPSLKRQLDFIDSAYITTFDSYALSIVKKYHYLINVSRNVGIVDSSIIDIKKSDFLDKIFDDLYENEDAKFLKFIGDFCVKDDKEIKKAILKINNSLELMYDKDKFLECYVDNYYSDSYVDKLISCYMNYVFNKHEKLKELYERVLTLEDDKKAFEYESALSVLINSSSYDDIKKNVDVSLPRIVKNSKDEKKLIKELLDELKELTFYDNLDDMKNIYFSTLDYVSVIISIIKKLDIMVRKYKEENNCYEFIDISKMAIDIVSNFDEVCLEIKEYYNEIMVDEYQDTNDLQEMFIKKIANNNVYMVGDIKQSIYRFRNANPLIFKDKYNLYSKGVDGVKIDLVKNFRSRFEVLDDINKMFNKIMDEFLGGANYTLSHQMKFGNLMYEENNSPLTNNNLEIYNYDPSACKNFDKKEIEAFIIANDIISKVNEGYLVIDKDTKTLRAATYSDFCIIMDRGTDFDLYKKIFEYKNIPLTVYKDEVLSTAYDILIIKNLINFVIKIKKNEFDQEFKYLFTSIARSFLFSLDDNYIFKTFKDNSFFDTKLYEKASLIAKWLDDMSCHRLLVTILDEFDFYDKASSYRDIDKTLIRVLYLENISKSLEELCFTPYDFAAYLNDMILGDSEIKYKVNTKDNASVKIMNIHKSKGLEFPICYYSGLYKRFNVRDISDKFIFDNQFGIVTPYYKDGIGALFTKSLIKDNYLKEEISEKIRLFYVGVTRAREKMIFVCPLDEDIYNDEKLVSDNARLKYRSFLDIVNTVKDEFSVNIINIDILNSGITKEYNIFRNKDFDFSYDGDKIVYKDVVISHEKIESKKFSKSSGGLKSLNEINNMKFGTDIHYLFEMEDFLHPKSDYVKKLLAHDLFVNINDARIFKEYEFVFENDNDVYRGVIDLMLVYDKHVDIVDYKLSNIEDDNYKKQLEGYRDYIFRKTGKPVNIYLYSIMDDVMKKM